MHYYIKLIWVKWVMVLGNMQDASENAAEKGLPSIIRH